MIAIKLRKLILPLLVSSAAFCLIYSAFNWYLVSGTGILPLDHEIAEFWLPMGLPLIVAAVFVQPGIRALRLNEKRSIPFLYFIVAVAAIAAPAVAAQLYVSAAAGGVTHVKSMADIATAARTKFYTVDSVCFARDRLGSYLAARPSATGDENHYYLYVVAPACKGGAWMGWRYDTAVETHFSDAEQDAQYHAFLLRAQKAFDAEDPSRYTFLIRVSAGFEKNDFGKAVRKAGGHDAAPEIFMPQTANFADRAGAGLRPAFIAFAAGQLVWLVLVLLAPLKGGAPMEQEKTADGEDAGTPGVARALFVPSRANYGLPLLLDANILVFLAMVLSGLGVTSFESEDLLAWGANFSSALHGWGVLRLVTSQFVHAGLAHIAANMYALVFMGLFIAPVVRNAGLIASYLICGLGGAVASALLHPDTVSVGASGAIMGLCGMLLALALWRDARIAVSSRVILANVGLSVVLTLGLGFAMPNIDNTAHVGGLVTGFVLGTLLCLTGKRQDAAAGG